MNYSDLISTGEFELPIIGNSDKSNTFIVSTTDGHKFSVPKLKFQYNQPAPPSIFCKVSAIKNGIPIVTQDISRVIASLYSKGNVYEFTVKDLIQGKVSSYTVTDDNGFVFKLNNAPKTLIPGKKIKCRVDFISGIKVKLSYHGQLSQPSIISFYTPEEWLRIIGCTHPEIFVHLYNDSNDFPLSHQELKAKNPLWIFTAIREFTDALPESFEKLDYPSKDTGGENNLKRLIDIMKIIREICQYIIEGSSTLKDLNLDQRNLYQERLTAHMESLKQYTDAAEKILKKEDKDFIDYIFHCLKVSGFIYHPHKQFRMLMTIFRLRRNLVSERMGELFEILNEWKLENWTTEPFRTALVDQLEIFISQNSLSVDSYAEIETGEDNKLLVKMILAIAVQSLLARKSDNLDLSLNKARFYRYLSYFNPKDTNLLLNEGIKCILGEEIKNEYTWTDTNNNPGILIEKATNAARKTNPAVAERSYKKIYSSDSVEIELTDQSLIIRGKDSDTDHSVIPNNIMDWMSPCIVLDDDIRTPTASKAKYAKGYDDMWADISNSIFRDNNDSQPHEYIRLRPEMESNVKVRIDGIDKTNFRFHCTIVDDNLEGSGWLPITDATLLPWLSIRDVPAYFDINADFFHDTDGNDLLFDVTVANSSNEELIFSMKNEIINYLTDSVSHGETSKAFVTHNDPRQTHLLCVSEKGYTLKVKSGPENEHLKPGQVVEVRYIERDEPSSKLYMIGEIINDNPLTPISIKKTVPFMNIMQGLGEAVQDDDNTVVEESQVLSAEEVNEIILMLWRRAYIETDLIKAYNYLSLAALLSKIIGDEKKSNELICHKKLLLAKETFSRDKQIATESILIYKNALGSNIMLRKIYQRVYIVSCLGNNEMNDRLWSELQNSSSDIDRQLISNVIALNLIEGASDDTGEIRAEIMGRIASLMNVNVMQHQLKYYGNESHKVEFKTSLVFSADRKGITNIHEYSPENQEREILKVVCGFINSEGGTLYVGVHDSGYEKGLADDLTYYKNYGYPSNTRLKVNIDNMGVYLTNLIKNKIAGFETNGGRVDKDPEARRDVLRVIINPSPTPVTLENEIFVRSGSSTFHLHGEKREEFIRNREMNYKAFLKRNQEIENDTKEEVSEEETEDQDTAIKMDQPIMDEKIIEEGPTTEPDADDDSEAEAAAIITGKHRNNILNDLGTDFVYFISPLRYIYFLPSNYWMVTTDFRWDKARLALIIHENEVQNHFLVVTNKDNSISLIPIEKFIKVQKDSVNHEPKLESVARIDIAAREDLLLNIIKVKPDYYTCKATPIKDLPIIDSFGEAGKKIYSQEHVIVGQEVVSPTKQSLCQEAKGYKDNQPGYRLDREAHESYEDMITRVLAPYALQL